MLKTMIITLVALFAVLVATHVIWRQRNKKKRDAARRAKYEDPRYVELEKEKEAIRRKRTELGLEHPFQRLLLNKIKLDRAGKNDDRAAADKYREAIDMILAEYEATEEQLGRGYHGQLAAMSRRLNQIEIEQRHILLEAERS